MEHRRIGEMKMCKKTATLTYELPEDHRLLVDLDEKTQMCQIRKNVLDGLIRKLWEAEEDEEEE